MIILLDLNYTLVANNPARGTTPVRMEKRLAGEQYRQWLAHYQQPTCEASLPSGERCAMPIDRVETPSRFVVGESNCCARHKAGARLRTVS